MEISNEDIEYDKELIIHLGSQDLKIKMSEGIQKGKFIEVTNYLTKTHNVHAKIHMRDYEEKSVNMIFYDKNER